MVCRYPIWHSLDDRLECALDIDDIKSRLGTGFEPMVYEVEKGMVHRFVQAIGDLNPRWQKVAPPTFLLTIGVEQVQQKFFSSFPEATGLHGGSEIECYQPVRAGDVLMATHEVTNVRERRGKRGTMVFITIETTHKDQKQELVAKCRQLVILYW